MPGFENGGLMEKEEKLRLEKGKQRLSQEEEGECIGQAEEDENGPSQLSIAAVAWSDWHMRIYFQDGRGGVHEDAYDDGVWRLSGIRNPQKELFTARLHSHLCAISWDEGQQIRIYYFTSAAILQEHCYSAGRGWYHGILNALGVRAAPYSHVSAIQWANNCSIRVYFQEPDSTSIQEYCYDARGGWVRGATLRNACRRGSALAATRWVSGTVDSHNRGLQIRLYYQEPAGLVSELCWEGGWHKGGFLQAALQNSPIAATSWYDNESRQVGIRVYSQNSQEKLVESRFSAWSWLPSSEVPGIGPLDQSFAAAAVELQNGVQQRLYLLNYGNSSEKCQTEGEMGGQWFTGEYLDSPWPRYM